MEKYNRLTVKDWNIEDRPREKLLAKGKKELSNAELIGIMIGSGVAEKNAVELAREILREAGDSLSLLSRMEVSELTKRHKGIGTAKAVSIIAALELGYRMLCETTENNEVYISDSKSLFNYISPSIIDLPHEEFWAIFLNIRNKVIFKQRISSGGITSTAVDIRLIFRTALEKNAVSIIVSHNHPAGSIIPSTIDKQLTQKMIDAGKTLNIPLVDHVIVGIDDNRRPNYFSFRDAGLV